MTYNEFKDLDAEDIEDIEDLLARVEASFDIRFDDNELINIKNFRELFDHTINKIQLENTADCTSQQAFYKLRNAISSTLQVDSRTITTETALADILPRSDRRSKVEEIEKHLGFKLNLLSPPGWVTLTFLIILFASLLGMIINWKVGLSGLCFSIFGMKFANGIGNELDLQTVGQVVEKMTRENYLKSRRNPKTFNREEIETVLIDWFSDVLGIEKSKLTKDEKFI